MLADILTIIELKNISFVLPRKLTTYTNLVSTTSVFSFLFYVDLYPHFKQNLSINL